MQNELIEAIKQTLTETAWNLEEYLENLASETNASDSNGVERHKKLSNLLETIWKETNDLN